MEATGLAGQSFYGSLVGSFLGKTIKQTDPIRKEPGKQTELPGKRAPGPSLAGPQKARLVSADKSAARSSSLGLLAPPADPPNALGPRRWPGVGAHTLRQPPRRRSADKSAK